ncbi:phage tail tape measure protein [Virgibacillus sp. M23]|uniref:phage tail tape measure protein n=1 Tax=Virgibacillus sp. M23 TaxID=3079030 RepID=UPI002A910352|nr:phage tail tape measure protein [Virgibacillus sp. M23]MDY7043696.1 phage tail tape measure protein [Virgibacillus sp. M23]
MSQNRIGIDVQVQFPTIRELQSQLAEKWRGVKNNFNGKINIDYDANSLRSMKSRLERALGDEVFKIKLSADMRDAMSDVESFRDSLRRLDSELGKHRELKIDLKGLDFDKPFKDILQDIKKIDEAMESQTRQQKAQNAELNETAGKMAKIQRIAKQMKDGSYNVTTKVTENGSLGQSKVTTQRHDGRVDFEETNNREKAIREIEQIAKRIHQIELDQLKAENDQFDLLERERRVQKEQYDLLLDMYKAKYKINAIDDKSLKELKNTQDISYELKAISALKKEEKKVEDEIAQAVSRVAQLESKKQSIALKMVNALDDEKKSLNEQMSHYNKIQESISKKYNLQEKMNDSQLRELANLSKIGKLEVERARSKKEQKENEEKLAREEKERQQAQKIALNELQSSLREVHRIQLQIQKIEERRANGGEVSSSDRARLEVLKKELEFAQRTYKTVEDVHNAQGNVTEEIRNQVNAQNDILNNERRRVSEISKIEAYQDNVNEMLREHQRVQRAIAQLQRDLVFAGMREESIIEDQIRDLKVKQEAIREGIRAEKAMTEAMEREIDAIERAQSEQIRLNRLRQDAREKDMAYNDTGGLVDPWSVYSNMEQGAMAVFEPIRELDEALVSITKVAEATEEQFAEFADGAYEAGSALGVSADEYMKAVEKWVTAGKSFPESQKLADVALTGAFVGNIDPENMVKYMSVPFESFRKEGLKATDIINVMNETANNHAIEMEDLGKAYVRSAMTAKDAGVSFQELNGMITGAQEATRKGGERIGTGLKSIALNVSTISGQLTPQFKRKFDFFKDIGVNFKDANGEMKSMTQIFSELNDVWDDLSDQDKSNAKYYLAGKEHAEVMGALLDQWDESIAQNIGESSAELGLGESGSAYKEHAKQADSVKFKLAELKNAWDELMHTVGGGGDGVATVLGIMTDGLKNLNELAQNEKLMEMFKYILAGVGIHATTNLMRRLFDTMTTGARSFIQRGSEAVGLLNDLRRKSRVSVDVPKVNKSPDKSQKNQTKSSSNVIMTPSYAGRKSSNDTKKELEEQDKHIKKTNNSIKTTGRLLGKVAGFIPVIGDALLVLDLMGIPVFEKMFGWLGDVNKSAEDLNKEYAEMNEKFKTSNSILNGDMEKSRKKVDDLAKSYSDLMSQDKDPNKNGVQAWLNEDEYFALKDQFNALTDELGLVDIKIQMNDTNHIEDQLQRLKDALNKLDAESTKDISNRVVKDLKKASGMSDDLKEYQKELDKTREKIEELKEKKEDFVDNGTPTSANRYANLNQELENAIKKEKDLVEQIEDTNKGLKAHGNFVDDMALELLKQGDALDTTQISWENAQTMVLHMEDGYNGLRKSLKRARDAQDDLSESVNISDGQLNDLRETFPSVASAFEGKNADMINSSADLRKALEDVVAQSIKNDEKTVKSAEQALILMGRRAGMEDEVRQSIKETGTVSDNVLQGLIDKFNLVPEKKTSKISVEGEVSQKAQSAFNLINTFGSAGNISRTVSVGAVSNSVSTNNQSNSVSSASVSTGGDLIKKKPKLQTIDKATSSNNSRVDSDIWRYWSTEMKIEDISQSINKLTSAIQKASENESQLISLYKRQNSTLKSQKSWYNRLSRQKNSEMSSILKQLRGYGFKTRGNDITNLSRAKSFKGDKAEKVEGLLNDWKSIGSDLTSISESIASLNETIRENNEAIKEAYISKELKGFETTIKRIESMIKTVGNSDSMFSKKLEFISNQDPELGLRETEKAMNASKSNMQMLLREFNKLSTSTIKYEENGESLKSQLDQLGETILAQADSILAYQESLNTLELNRVTNDLSSFNDAIDDNTSKIRNNIDNLKEGLLSGTDIDDLQSSVSTALDLDRDNQFKERARERLALEQQVQQALEAFAKKNIDRERNVANATLRIKESMYNHLLKMEKDYSNGKVQEFNNITETLKSHQGTATDSSYRFDDELEKHFDDIKKKQDELTEKYQNDMVKANNSDEQEKLTNQYIIDNLKLQESYYRASIDASKDAITELKGQLKDPTLTDELESQIKQQIENYEKEITESQNNIKESIAERFEFEFSLLDEALDKYDKYSRELEYSLDILNAIGGENYSSQGVLLSELMNIEKSRNKELENSLSSLKQQQMAYEEGSYEWKIINAEIEEYNNLLQESNKTLLEMNKNIMSNSFDGVVNKIEKQMFDGKTLENYQNFHELWLTGLEREIALEKAYQRLSDLETDIYDKKMEQLDKQEKLSKFEMDYLNKQLDVLELEQKLDNLNKEKTIQTLKQQADGTWDWEYVADADQISQVQEELSQAELELQELEQKAREDYLSQLEKILTNAEEGDYDNIQDFRNALEELSKAFDSAVGDFPKVTEDYISELVESYSDYINNNKDIIDGVVDGLEGTPAFDGYSDKVIKEFHKIGKDIGNIIADALISELPKMTTPKQNEVRSNSVSINLDKVEFPSITSADGIKEAIFELPQIALQMSKGKIN